MWDVSQSLHFPDKKQTPSSSTNADTTVLTKQVETWVFVDGFSTQKLLKQFLQDGNLQFLPVCFYYRNCSVGRTSWDFMYFQYRSTAPTLQFQLLHINVDWCQPYDFLVFPSLCLFIIPCLST